MATKRPGSLALSTIWLRTSHCSCARPYRPIAVELIHAPDNKRIVFLIAVVLEPLEHRYASHAPFGGAVHNRRWTGNLLP